MGICDCWMIGELNFFMGLRGEEEVVDCLVVKVFGLVDLFGLLDYGGKVFRVGYL